MKVLKFHEGRGGRFNNAGHTTFIGFERIDEGKAYSECWFDDDDQLIEGVAGNALEAEIRPDGTGYINHDFEYDRTTCVFENDLTEKQINALKRELKSGAYEDEAREILEKYYPEYID